MLSVTPKMADKREVELLAGRIRPLLASEDAVVEMRMFGGLAFLVNGNMSVAASGQGGLMLRCQPAETERLVTEPGVARMEMRGRSMDGWLRADREAIATEPELERWVRVGVDFAKSLPPKA